MRLKAVNRPWHLGQFLTSFSSCQMGGSLVPSIVAMAALGLQTEPGWREGEAGGRGALRPAPHRIGLRD